MSGNPFGINFEIPPLPSLEGEQEFSIMSFLAPRQAKKKSPESNRRVIKQKDKEETRVGKIWDIMPSVNEDFLDHNLKSESGIQRLWEDISLDMKMRDMRISEAGLLIKLKSDQVSQLYFETVKPAFEIEKPLVIEERELVNAALLML